MHFGGGAVTISYAANGRQCGISREKLHHYNGLRLGVANPTPLRN